MTTVATSYWPADTSEPVLETTVGGVLRAAAAAAPQMPAPEELRAHCRDRLAPYKTPEHWVFVDAFPMTPSGKIQKYKLRESFTSDQPSA